jgi:hypothetical protein
MIRKLILFVLIITPFVWSGCDVIDENNRTIEMGGIVPVKRILLLDFTDQDCINCLKAAEEIKNLLGIYKDTLVAVSIHASYRPFPLVTEDGNKYEEHFKVNVHPTGIIDGTFSSANPQQWGGIIMERFQTEALLDLNMAISYEEATRTIDIHSHIKGLKDCEDVRLLLWVIESKIINRQLMQDGKYNQEYEHNHVFRASINGTFGGVLSVKENEEKEIITDSYVLNDKWVTENVSIVGFVYDAKTDEVLDVTEIKLNDLIKRN